MAARRPKRGALCAAFVLLATSVLGAWGPVPAAAQESDAAPLLDRVAGAEGATYHARQIVVLFGEERAAAVVDVRSTPEATFVRAESGPDVTRLWRRAQRGIVEAPAEAIEDRAAPDLPLDTQRILNKYEVTVGPSESMLGVTVVPLTLVRRADDALVERLWVHELSGVVYRRELYGDDGDLVGMSAVFDMRWGEDAMVEPFDRASRTPLRVDVADATEAPPRLPGGYGFIGASTLRAKGYDVTHWIYTDGFHALSVFRLEGHLRPPAGFNRRPAGERGVWQGPGPGTWAWEGGGSAFMLVAEEPRLDPAQMTAAFPAGGTPVWARLGSLWARGFRAVWGLLS